jgi:hypothetical protein
MLLFALAQLIACCSLAVLLAALQGLVPSLVMVSNPTIQYILYEWLTVQLASLRRDGTSGYVLGVLARPSCGAAVSLPGVPS